MNVSFSCFTTDWYRFIQIEHKLLIVNITDLELICIVCGEFMYLCEQTYENMDTINNDLTNLLQQMGVHQESLGITQRIVMIAGILIIAFVADYFCRKIIVPTIKKLTARTQATWDDYLFNDAVLDNMCHLIPPIILYVLLPFAFPHEPVTLTFILKLCWVYITAVAMKLICSFLTSLYTISSEHEKLKESSSERGISDDKTDCDLCRGNHYSQYIDR